MKIMHIITGLEIGGAETMLAKLVSAMRPVLFENLVVSLTGLGPIGERMRADGIRVQSLGMARGVPDPSSIYRLAALMRREKPDLVQTWLYHADLLGGIAAKLAGLPVIWNIRQNTPRQPGTKPLTWLSATICAGLSGRVPQKILCCSESVLDAHKELGYDAGKFLVIPNGFDLTAFCPDPNAYQALRSGLGLNSGQLLIGHVARYHPMKDHPTFLKACAIVSRTRPETRFVLCGEGVSDGNEVLRKQIADCALESVCHLLGRRDNMASITAAFDIACLSSIDGEGFPNVIGEAMACAVPCVVTDAGGSAAIVGETGIVVSPGSAEDLANGLLRMIDMGREGRCMLGKAAHDRVRRLYDLPAVAAQYEDLYLSYAPVATVARQSCANLPETRPGTGDRRPYGHGGG